MGESSDAQKFSMWLGIAVSLIAVLAFFGVTSFEDLKKGETLPGPRHVTWVLQPVMTWGSQWSRRTMTSMRRDCLKR